MLKLLFILIVIAYAAHFGVRLSDLAFCHSRQCINRMEKAKERILDVDWQPIRGFPEADRQIKQWQVAGGRTHSR